MDIIAYVTTFEENIYFHLREINSYDLDVIFNHV
jgi:hypothetical protein